MAFVEDLKPAKTLIFATIYVDTPGRRALVEHWLALHQRLNPDCDFLLVDSNSPSDDFKGYLRRGGFIDRTDVTFPAGARKSFYSFPDNIGHLNKNGRDGWGRAFCYGLQAAIDGGYDTVVHIEGDSLFRLPVKPIVRDLRRDRVKAASTPVTGMRIPGSETGWVETGLMFFDTKYLAESGFIDRYDWPNRRNVPSPEKVIRSLLGDDLAMMPWKGVRDDTNAITVNVGDLDWITHCRDGAVYDRFVALALGPPPPPPVKINLGCGSNRLAGWDNHDADINIVKRLPWPDAHADFIFAEHVVEHVTQYQAIAFLRECRRVIKPGGVLRIAVPSIESIWKRGDPEYFAFVKKWAPSLDLRGAMHAILHAHGHQAAWTESLLQALLFFAGFDRVTSCEIGCSSHPALKGVEGHGRVIGERMNRIETVVCEAL